MTTAIRHEIEAALSEGFDRPMTPADGELFLAMMRGVAEAAERYEEIIRRILDVPIGLGHALRPVAERDRELVQRANDSMWTAMGEVRRSLRCWDCSEESDRPVSPGSEVTHGDWWHEAWAARQAAVTAMREVE